jgi:hypothetical protein
MALPPNAISTRTGLTLLTTPGTGIGKVRPNGTAGCSLSRRVPWTGGNSETALAPAVLPSAANACLAAALLSGPPDWTLLADAYADLDLHMAAPERADVRAGRDVASNVPPATPVAPTAKR